MFMGTHIKRTDAKSRVSVPAAFRRDLEQASDQRLVLVRSLVDPSITAYPMAKWQERVAYIESLPQSNKTVATVKKFLFSCAAVVTPDSHGRILLSQDLRDFAGISPSADVALVGLGATFDLYEASRWQAEANAATAAMPAVRPDLEKWDF